MAFPKQIQSKVSPVHNTCTITGKRTHLLSDHCQTCFFFEFKYTNVLIRIILSPTERRLSVVRATKASSLKQVLVWLMMNFWTEWSLRGPATSATSALSFLLCLALLAINLRRAGLAKSDIYGIMIPFISMLGLVFLQANFIATYIR